MSTEVQIAFPGIGIEPFTVNKVAFELFGVEVRWYGIIIVLGMIFAFAYAMYRSPQEGFTRDEVMDMGLFLVIFGVIGARLYYVIMKWDTFVIPGRSLWQNLKAIVNIRSGGLAIYGGVIAGAATIVVYSVIKKKRWQSALDMVAPGVMIAQAMGRWGNFFNGEAYGGVVSETHPLYFMRMGLYPNNVTPGAMAYVHPTFLYESLWNILGFVLIHFLVYRHKKFHGQVAMSYLAWYGFGRMWIEGLRTDSLYVGNIRISQLVAGLCFVAFTAWIVVMLIQTKKRQQQENGDDYVPAYSTAPVESAPLDDAAGQECVAPVDEENAGGLSKETDDRQEPKQEQKEQEQKEQEQPKG